MDALRCACTQSVIAGSSGRCAQCGLPVPQLGAIDAVQGWSLARAALRARRLGLGPPRVEATLVEREPGAATAFLRFEARGFGLLFTRQHVAARAEPRDGWRGWWERRVDAFRAWRFYVVLGHRSALLRIAARVEACSVTAFGVARFARYEFGFADGVTGWLAGAARARTPALASRAITLAPAVSPSSKRVTLFARPPRFGAVSPLSRALGAARPALLTVLVPSTVDGPLLRARDPQEPA